MMSRAIAFFILLSSTHAAMAADELASSRSAFRPVALAEARWTTGYWADRFETCRAATIPTIDTLMEGTERSQFLHNFRIAAALAEGKHRGPPWNDGDCYKWLEAAATTFAITRDPALDIQMDRAIATIAKAQRADGYLHTPVLIAQRSGDSSLQPFQDRLNFEMYNFGHLFTAAAVHHQATGKRTLLDVAIKAADFLSGAFQSPTPELARNSVCPAHYMGAVDLYRVTGDARHLALAKRMFALRDLVADGTDDNQDRFPFRLQSDAVGHAVRANYLYAGAADLYLATGDESLLVPLEKIWASAVTQKMYITGGCGALYDGASPDGSKEQKQIARVHQAYGRAYQLPNSTAHNETCAAVGLILWNWRMLQITGEVKYADVLELALYNALLAGVSLDGKRFFYTNTLRQLDTMPADLRWSREREAWISCFCCPPNVARTVAQANHYAYGVSDSAVWVHLYGGSTLDMPILGGQLKLKQETEYPWDGRVTITVERAPQQPMSLRLRIPAWAQHATLAVGGEPSPAVAGKYAEVRRQWQAGDVVHLDLHLKPRLMEAHPLIEETRNQMAVMYGPLVYCLESTDLPPGTSVQSVRLPHDIEFTSRFDRKLLSGVRVLEGKAQVASESPFGAELYRERQPPSHQPLGIRLIPYYAWANRGRSEMTVWMPLGR